jgi:hypothetical protein
MIRYRSWHVSIVWQLLTFFDTEQLRTVLVAFLSAALRTSIVHPSSPSSLRQFATILSVCAPRLIARLDGLSHGVSRVARFSVVPAQMDK